MHRGGPARVVSRLIKELFRSQEIASIQSFNSISHPFVPSYDEQTRELTLPGYFALVPKNGLKRRDLALN